MFAGVRRPAGHASEQRDAGEIVGEPVDQKAGGTCVGIAEEQYGSNLARQAIGRREPIGKDAIRSLFKLGVEGLDVDSRHRCRPGTDRGSSFHFSIASEDGFRGAAEQMAGGEFFPKRLNDVFEMLGVLRRDKQDAQVGRFVLKLASERFSDAERRKARVRVLVEIGCEAHSVSDVERGWPRAGARKQ